MNEQVKLALRIGKYVVAFLVILSTFYTVGAGTVAVKFNRVSGTTSSNINGLHFKIPLVDSITKFDVKTKKFNVQAAGASKDLQKVSVTAELNYHLKYDKVNELFVQVGSDYEDKIILPAMNELIKAATAKYPAEKVIQERESLRTEMETMLSSRMASYNIQLEYLNLVDIDFDEEFNKTVERKQIEEQNIKTEEYKKEQAKQRKEATILDAQAEAEKQRLMKSNVTKDIVALEWIKKWNGTLPATMLGDKSTPMVSLDK